MSAQRAAEPLDDVRIHRLRKRVSQLRALLTEALHLIGEVYESDDWKLVSSSWEDFCATELPELAQLRLEPEQRRAVVVDLASRGLSQRGIGAPLGLSAQTVGRELKAAGVVRDKVKGRDGRLRPASQPVAAAPAPATSSLDRVVNLVAAAGPDGLTVREVLRKARDWHHGQASGALSRAHARGRLIRTPSYRAGCATYVVVPVDEQRPGRLS